MLTALIVDDEQDAREALRYLIAGAAPRVEILGEAVGFKELKRQLGFYNPDILFLDIMLGSKNIMQFLPELNLEGCSIIFTTAYDNYILQAIRLSALDYLLKPIDKEELQKAIIRVERNKKKISRENLEIFEYNLNTTIQAKKIALPTGNVLEIVSLADIIYCKGDGAYTKFYLADKRVILVSKNLHEFEKQFLNCKFCRVHHSYLINVAHIKAYIKGEGGRVKMSNGNEIDISRRRKGELMALLK